MVSPCEITGASQCVDGGEVMPPTPSSAANTEAESLGERAILGLLEDESFLSLHAADFEKAIEKVAPPMPSTGLRRLRNVCPLRGAAGRPC